MLGSTKNAVDETHTIRQRLDSLSGFRIRSSKIRFTSGGSLGHGGKADVVRALKLRRWYSREGQVVAVKKLRVVETKKARNEFVHEVEVLAGLSHENVVQLVGFVENLKNGIAWIVLSWLPNGNLSDFLARGSWEIPERISLIKDTFEGVKYLHTRQPPLCHGDIKSFNILVSPSYHAVITDLGSARGVSAPEEVIGDEGGQEVQEVPTTDPEFRPIQVGAAGNQLTLTGPAWSLRWAAPEVVKGRRPGLLSDVWAAGWVCWEVMTDKLPFSELNIESAITLKVVRGKVPAPREEGQLAQIVALCSLMADSWAFNPKARPDITRCCNEVQWMPSTPPSGGKHSGSNDLSIDLLLQKGRVSYKQDNYEEACLLFEQALSLATSAANQTAIAYVLDLLGGTYHTQLRYSKAEESFTRAQDIYAHIGDDAGRASTLGGLGAVYRAQSKYTEAEEAYNLEQEIYGRIGDDAGRASTLNGLGDVYRAQSKYTQAEESYTQAQEICDRIGDDLTQVVTLEGLGDVYRLQSKYTQAEESYTRAEEIYARIGNDEGRASTLYGLGEVYRDQSKYVQAEAAFTRGQEIFARVGAELGQVNTLHGLREVYRVQSKYTQAEESSTRALEICARIGNDLGLASTLSGLGEVYRNQSKYTQAEEAFTQAQDICTRIGHDSGLATTLRSLGHVYRGQGRHVEAATHYKAARDLYAHIGMADEAEDTSDCLAAVLQDNNSSTTSPEPPLGSDI